MKRYETTRGEEGPLNWSILEKRKHFICNLIKYSSGIDNGSIVIQKNLVLMNLIQLKAYITKI